MLLCLILPTLWSLNTTGSPDTIHWLTRQICQWTSVYLCRKILLSLTLWPTHHWHLCNLWTPLCNHWILWFSYLHLRPPCLFLSGLTLLFLVLWHSCKYQNFWALVTLNSVFTLQIFRLTPQNLQKLLIFPMSLLCIMNSPTFSAKPKLKSITDHSNNS